MFKFIGQLLAVYPVACVIAMPVGDLYVQSLGKSLDNTDGDPRQSIVIVVFLTVGLILGSICAVSFRSLVSSGQWIWAVPVSLLILAFGTDLWRSDPSKSYSTVSHITMIYFYSTGDDEKLTSFLATFPAFTYLGYSAAMWIVKRRRATTM